MPHRIQGNSKPFRKVAHLNAMLLLFLLTIIDPVRTRAQEVKFDNFSVEQGLSQGNTNAIIQDHYGFIWIATEDGLNLFDGYTFTIFRNIPTDSTTISNNNIRCLAEDRSGNIWVGTLNGLDLYHRASNRFIHYNTKAKGNAALTSDEIHCVYFDADNKLWVGTAKGINVLDSASQTFRYFSHQEGEPNSLPHNAVKSIVQDNSRRYWMATPAGLSMLSTDLKTYTNYTHDPANPESLSSNNTLALFYDKTHTLWVATFDGGLNRMHSGSGTFTRYMSKPDDPKSIGSQYVHNLIETKSGEIWVATDAALSLMDRKNGTFTNFRNVPGDPKSLSKNIVMNVFSDSNERLWVCTRFGGVNVYDKEKYGFQQFSHRGLNTNSIASNTVNNFDEDEKGNLYIVMDGGGLNYLDRPSGIITDIAPQGTPNGLSINKALAVEVDNSGKIWVGTWSGGVNRYDPETKKMKYYRNNPDDPGSLSDNSIFDLLEDKKGNIWIATYSKGINKYNPETDNFTRYTNNPTDPKSINPSAVRFLYEDHDGIIWVAMEQDGLSEFNPNTGLFTHYRNDNTPGSINSNSLYAIFEDSKNRLWIGTSGGGLNLFDRQTKKFKAYRESDGLPNDAVVGILEDKEGNLWLSTNKGLCRFNPDKKTFKNFTVGDGLQGNQFNRWAAFRTSAGELIFGGTNGFNLFDPAKIQDNKFIPPIYITDFKLFNKAVPIGENEILKTHILFTRDIELDYSQNFFSFEFTALNYRQSEKNQYKYIMEGFQDEWIEAGTERKVSYTNLSPGKYTLRVIGSNNDGVWNKEGVAVSITIIPPFWRTWWFISAVILATSYSIVSYNRRLKKKSAQQKIELERIIEEQTREVKQQHDEILKKAESERVQNWITNGLAKTSEVISKHKGSLEGLSHQILKNLMQYIGAYQGVMALAMRDEGRDEYLEILATYGINKERTFEKIIEPGNGLIGAAYLDKEKKVLEAIPSDYIKIESGLGKTSPAMIILQPLNTEDGDTLGVVEIAFLEKPAPEVNLFLDKVSSIIALNVHAANLSNKTSILLQESKERTEELRAQEEEMRQNMEELEATQEEMNRQMNELNALREELEAERYLFSSLMDSLPDAIYFKDKSSKFIRVSKYLADHFGADEKDLIGKSDFDFADEQHATSAFEDEKNIMRTRQPKIDFVEKEVINGEEHWVSTTKMPLLNSKGEVVGTFGISRDVTKMKLLEQQSKEHLEELRAQEEELRQNMEELEATQEHMHQQMTELTELKEKLEKEKYLFASLMDYMPDAIYFKDKDSKFIRVSKYLADHFGAKEEDLIGKSDFDFQDASHAKLAFEDEKTIMQTRNPKIDFIEREVINGEEHWVSTTKMPLINAKGEVVGTFGISSDVTKMKKLEQDFRLKDELLRKEEKEYEEKIKALEATMQLKEKELARIKLLLVDTRAN